MSMHPTAALALTSRTRRPRPERLPNRPMPSLPLVRTHNTLKPGATPSPARLSCRLGLGLLLAQLHYWRGAIAHRVPVEVYLHAAVSGCHFRSVDGPRLTRHQRRGDRTRRVERGW